MIPALGYTCPRRDAGTQSSSLRLPRQSAFLLLLTFALLRPASAMIATGVPVRGCEAYDAKIPVFLEKWDIPGATIAVALDGKIVFARGYGYADVAAQRPMQPDTRGRIGSVSKVVTASAILKLVDQGRLSLSRGDSIGVDF